MNVEARDLEAAQRALLRVPNMTTTGRLPGVALLHVGMRVRGSGIHAANT